MMSPLNRSLVRTLLNLTGFLLLYAFTFTTSASAQWMRAASPIETQTVTGTGAVAPFSFTLPANMAYWVRSSGRVQTTTGGDRADSRYYISSGTPLPSGPIPLGIPVGLRVRQNATTDVFMQTIAPSGFQASSIYVGSVQSTGVPLAFRFFDRVEPGSGGIDYYADNSGSMTIEVSQATPELIVQTNTLDFGVISTRYPKTLIDSIQSYGKLPLGVTRVWIEPVSGAPIFTVVSERGQSFQLPESATNEFRVTASTTIRGTHTARLHIESNAWQDPDHIILLRAVAQGPEIIATPFTDTLDFGVISAGASTSKTKLLTNVGDSATRITSLTITPQNAIFTQTHQPELAVGVAQRIDFTFTPPAPGTYIAQVDVQFEWGPPKRFYLKGKAGTGIPKLDVNEVDFGTVILGSTASSSVRLRNLGDAEFLVTNVSIDGDQFTYDGPVGIRRVGAFPSTTDFPVSFRPTRHVTPYHEATMTLTFNNHPPLTVTLRGRDRYPITTALHIDTAYYVRAGEQVIVKQKLLYDVSGTLVPITKFSQFIQFDKEILELVEVRKGAVIADAGWELVSVQTGGAIDIIIQNLNGRLGGPGVLLEYVFRVLRSAPPGASSPVSQRTPNFYNAAEPQATVSDGIVHVIDKCSPPQLVLTRSTGTSLGQNYPNPFNPSTTIPFSLGSEAPVRLTLYDEVGREAMIAVDATLPAGFHRVLIDAASLSAGIYFYTLDVAGERIRRTMILTK